MDEKSEHRPTTKQLDSTEGLVRLTVYTGESWLRDYSHSKPFQELSEEQQSAVNGFMDICYPQNSAQNSGFSEVFNSVALGGYEGHKYADPQSVIEMHTSLSEILKDGSIIDDSFENIRDLLIKVKSLEFVIRKTNPDFEGLTLRQEISLLSTGLSNNAMNLVVEASDSQFRYYEGEKYYNEFATGPEIPEHVVSQMGEISKNIAAMRNLRKVAPNLFSG